MSQQSQPRRRPRRIRFLAVAAAVAVALVAWGVLRSLPSGGTPGDYRDPATLAKAVKAQEHATAASCGKLTTGKYLCVAANADGTSGTYTVTVSADGKSYRAS